MNQRDPIGIVTRADVALSAKNLDVIKRHVHEAIGNIKDVPAASRAAAQDLRIFTQWQQSRGGVSVRHRNLWMQHVEALRDEYLHVLDDLAAEMGLATSSRARMESHGERGNLDRSDTSYRRANALRERVTRLRAALEEAAEIRFDAGAWAPWQSARPRISPVVHGAFPLGVGDSGVAGMAQGPSLSWHGNLGDRVRARIPPAARLWFWGPTGTAGGWARGGAQAAVRKLRGLQGMAGMMAAGYVLSEARASIPLAQQYATDLLQAVAQRDLFERDGGGAPRRAGDPWFATKTTRWADAGRGDRWQITDLHPFKTVDAGVLRLRTTLERLGRDWLATTAEGIQTVQALGHEYRAGRARAVVKFARETGIDVGRGGAWYRAMLQHVAPIRTRVHVLAREDGPPLERVPTGPEASRFRASHPMVFGQGAAKTVSDTSLMQDALKAMHWSAVGRSRPEDFLDDTLAAAQAMSAGQGLVERWAPLGLTAVLHESGMAGAPWRSTLTGLISGTSSGAGPEDAITAGRLGAVRQYMPAEVTMGAGPYQRTLRTSSVRDAMRVVQSGHPSVVLAYMRYAAAKSGGDDETARDIFGRMMGGALNTMQVDALWANRQRLAGWQSAGRGAGVEDPTFPRWIGGKWAPPEAWLEGPKWKGTTPRGGTWGSVGRLEAEKDWTSHRMGRRLAYVAEDMRDAVVTAADALAQGEGPLEALLRGAERLHSDARAILGLSALASGGPTGAARAAFWFGGVGSPMGGAAPTPQESPGLSRDQLGAEAQRLGVELDAMVMATVGLSEAGDADPAERRAIMHTLHNRVANGDAPDVWTAAVGRAQGQTTGAQRGRPYSTRLVPGADRRVDLLAEAGEVLNERYNGEAAGGVTHYIHPLTQARLHASQPELYASPEEVARRREAAGLERYVPPGTDPARIWFWRPVSR